MQGGLGRGLINAKPQPYRREVDEGQVVGGEFVTARCDPTTLFDLIKESFDQVACTVKIPAEADRLVTITSRRGDARI